MDCIIIDDETMARTIIAQLISQEPALTLTHEFDNAMSAIKYLNQPNTTSLIFLDIHMPGFSGIDFVQTLKNLPAVILITSDKNYAIEAFEYDCIVDYLVKPLTAERFHKAVTKALTRQETALPKAEAAISNSGPNMAELPADNANEFYVNIDRRLIKIEIPTINLIQAKGDYIYIKTDTKNYTVHSTMKKIEEKLPASLFLKVHRTFIINTKKIVDIEDNSVLIGKDVVPVSRSNRPELMKRLNKL